MDYTRSRSLYVLLCAFLLCTSCTGNQAAHPGYIEGEYTYIASGVSGTLFSLTVQRGQTITQGTLLYALDPNPEKDNALAYQAHLADLQAQTTFSKAQYERQKILIAKNATPKATLEEAQTDFLSKSQQHAETAAQLAQANWSLQQKMQYAPLNGQVFDTFYRVGEKVEANHPVLALLAPENIKVLFYIPEAELHKIKLGQSITFSCDHCKGKTRATISYISPEAEFTPPVIYSKDTRYKLVYLVRASMPLEISKQFHPGQPIDVYL